MIERLRATGTENSFTNVSYYSLCVMPADALYKEIVGAGHQHRVENIIKAQTTG